MRNRNIKTVIIISFVAFVLLVGFLIYQVTHNGTAVKRKSGTPKIEAMQQTRLSTPENDSDLPEFPSVKADVIDNTPHSSNVNQPQLLSICKGNNYISIGKFYDCFHIPGISGKSIECEGKSVLIKAYIDFANVFDKKRYPQLPYEKFKIYDRDGKSLEVWALSDDNSEVFERIFHNKASPERMVFVKGTVVGFDMHMMGGGRRGVKLNIEDADCIRFE